MNKTCKACGKTKPGAEFYPHPAMADGTLNFCKSCIKMRAKYYRLANPRVQEYDRHRSKTPKRRAHWQANAVRWRQQNLKDTALTTPPITRCATASCRGVPVKFVAQLSMFISITATIRDHLM